MSKLSKPVAIALEVGSKRLFASALEWPGWTRSGRDESTALESLLVYGPRYQRAIRAARLGYQAPTELSEFTVVERLPGTSTTDFGAPDVVAAAELEPLDEDAFKRSVAILNACWETLGSAFQAASGKELRKGPRGGGRDAEKIIEHAIGAHYSYLRSIGWKAKRDESGDIEKMLHAAKKTTGDALAAAREGELPTQGPRGGTLWPHRYFVRRAAWHLLDHVWEIEDRIQS